jgi:glycerophosphoryl diester phosphodiesterase
MPITIAHRAGNSLATLARAITAGVDYAEADVWLYRGRLEVRHSKTLGPLPILWDRWFVRLMPPTTRRLTLTDLLTVRGNGRLLLDLKGRAEDLADAIADALKLAQSEDGVAFTGSWPHLDRLGAKFPKAPRFYSLGTPERLDALRPRLARREISGISIDSRFSARRSSLNCATRASRRSSRGTCARKKRRDACSRGASTA